jgi:hypothetical protein
MLSGVRRLIIASAAAMLLTYPCFPQTSKVGDSCDLAVFGQHDAKDFLAFDSELRFALSRQDVGALALLVEFPFRVNDSRGSWYVHDADSLGARFQQIFPPAVRAAVLNAPAETSLFCTFAGISYGKGTVWVNLFEDAAEGKPKIQRYLVEAVNLPEPVSSKPAATGSVEFVCHTDKHRVIVDIGPGGGPHYRAWNIPRALTEKPDLEIPKGEKTVEGTGPCSHDIWTFMSGTTKFTLSKLGCFPDSNQPPRGARGQLVVSAKDEVWWWCY